MGNAAEERDWVERARKGDHEAFGFLVENHQARVHGLVAKLLGPGHPAIEDVAQDVFVKAYFSLKKFRGKSSFGTWIYRIAINRARDEMRKKTPRVSLEEAEASLENNSFGAYFSSQNENGEGPAAPPEELRHLIGLALEALPEKLRVVATLKEMEGHSYTEVSQILKCAVGTVKSRQSQARKIMREFLEPHLEGNFKGGRYGL